jgi:hypothetical protein
MPKNGFEVKEFQTPCKLLTLMPRDTKYSEKPTLLRCTIPPAADRQGPIIAGGMHGGSSPFHDRDGWIWMDGEFVPTATPASTYSRTPCTTPPACSKASAPTTASIFKSREHSERLHNRRSILGFKLPYAAEEIDRAKPMS